jgi:hypothetical protein
MTAAMTAQILLSWLKLLALDGDLASAEPKTLRYRVLNAAARLVRGGRRRRWKIAANWPWAEAITRAWQRITALLTPAYPREPVPATCGYPSGPVEPCGTGPPAGKPPCPDSKIPVMCTASRAVSSPSAPM